MKLGEPVIRVLAGILGLALVMTLARPGGSATAAARPGGSATRGADVLVEAEGFKDPGGWVVDQQFMDLMGSPYLLAHGMGKPVAPARTEVAFPEAGTYHLWVRTKDWVPPHHPGTFKVVVDGVPAANIFGNQGTGWLWQKGGTFEIRGKKATVELVDLTGFEGRCDALYFTTDASAVPPSEPGPAMDKWRHKLLGLPETPPSAGEFDVVIVGGGIAGTAAAVTAARLGCTVALIQDRPVLGGNNSPEIRVHTGGLGGPVVNEVNGNYGNRPQDSNWLKEPSPATVAAEHRQKVVDAEKNIKQFLGWHAYAAATKEKRIASVDARNISTNEERRFAAPIFIDCTGDGSVAAWAGCEFRMGREAQTEYNESLAPESRDKMTLGTSLLWGSMEGERETTFPVLPWAAEVSKDLAATSGDWTWETGHSMDTITDAEEIRDHMFRAIYGSFSTAKNGKDKEKNAKRDLLWMGYVGGKRESRRIIGDYVLTQNDILECKQFPDGVAIGSWSIDLHYPKGYDFRTYAQFTKTKPYPIPFRCLYSKDMENLMLAGRDISETHAALGSTRVMNTGGQMGVATGAAALLCKKFSTTPRGVYEKHLQALLDIVKGEGEYKNALGSEDTAKLSPFVRVGAATGLTIGKVEKSGNRCSGSNPLAEVPEAYVGLPCATLERGSYAVAAPGYVLEVDRPVTVYLAVHDRGKPKLAEGWEKTDQHIRWKGGANTYADTVYQKKFAAGKIEIPGHDGTDGHNFGLPNMAIIGDKDAKVKPATP